MKILLVEDSKPIRHENESALRKAGYEVDCAEDGEVALQLARELHPDMILLDMILPKVSGPDVVGLAFHVGARVAAKARPGEVLVSSSVKDLMAQSAVRFKDRGVHRLKGVPERFRLYRVEH